MGYSVRDVATPHGELRHLELPEDESVIIDLRGPDLLFSWTGACHASDFISLCQRLPPRRGKRRVTISLNGKMLGGDSKEIIKALDAIPVERLDRECRFARFDLAKIGLAFHVLPSAGSTDSIQLITAFGRRIGYNCLIEAVTATGGKHTVDMMHHIIENEIPQDSMDWGDHLPPVSRTVGQYEQAPAIE
ncbi:hypothetical protein [Kitasatospora terrestris]|uniref:Uncharacterized protein n=1 Tax=Kitasatospora terrestris TaxID=258051 RepID=A0ABP9DSY1_9ACTN